MKFLSWNIDGTSAVLKKCDFMDCLWMWKADIFAFQKTKFRKREVGIKFPGYYDYWSFYENCPTSHQQSDNSQGDGLLAYFPVIRHTCLAKRSVPVARLNISGRRKRRNLGNIQIR